MYSGKNILVTGGTGLIGRPLVELLLAEGANVRVASLDDPSRAPKGAEFIRANLMHFDNCIKVCKGMDYVFNLVGIKGSPAMTSKKPASFFVPTITFNTNMMEAARISEVEKYLFTSSIGVYSPAEVFYEEDVWKTFPSENDRFAGWAKRMGELQAQAYQIEHNWTGLSIVRPANVYGSYDNFDPANAMVIPSLIARVMGGERPLTVWGDGAPIRDFIHARDVARGMMHMVAKGVQEPVNLGSGTGISIREVVEVICECLEEPIEVKWDTSKPSGDSKRIMDMERAKSHGFESQVSLKQGIQETLEWYAKNRKKVNQRYNVFTQSTYF